MRRDRDVEPIGDALRCCIGRDSGDPTLGPFRDGCVEADSGRNVKQQIVQRSAVRAVAVDRWLRTAIEWRQHGPQRRVVAHQRIDAKRLYRADELTEEFDVPAQSRIRRIGRANEEMRSLVALDNKDLGVQLCEEALVRLPVVKIPGEARCGIKLKDFHFVESVLRQRVELPAARDEHCLLAGPSLEDPPDRALANEW